MAVPLLIQANKKISSKGAKTPGPKIYTPKNTFDTKESESDENDYKDNSLKAKKGMTDTSVDPDSLFESNQKKKYGVVREEKKGKMYYQYNSKGELARVSDKKGGEGFVGSGPIPAPKTMVDKPVLRYTDSNDKPKGGPLPRGNKKEKAELLEKLYKAHEQESRYYDKTDKNGVITTYDKKTGASGTAGTAPTRPMTLKDKLKRD